MSAHPVRGYLAASNTPIAELSAYLSMHSGHVGMVLAGRRPASPEFRAKVAAYLDKPEADLFHEPGEAVTRQIEELVRSAPELTPEQRDRLGQILSGAA